MATSTAFFTATKTIFLHRLRAESHEEGSTAGSHKRCTISVVDTTGVSDRLLPGGRELLAVAMSHGRQLESRVLLV